jgi:SAM-dependent methyltransferase
MARVSNAQVKAFWEMNPVAAAAIDAERGSEQFFRAFDVLRETPECEPYDFSNKIHGYDRARGRRVLDIGCGNGYVLAQYAKFGAEVHGIDLTETALNLTRRRFAIAGYSGDFRITDGDKIPYPDEKFDIVCSMGVLHHIEDPMPMMEEVFRVLRPGGQLILMLYYRYSFKYLVIMPLKRLLVPGYWGKSLQQVLNMNDGEECPLAKVYTKPEVRKMLHRFQGVEFTLNQLSWRQLFLIPPLGQILSAILPSCSESFFARHFGWSLYVRAIKPLK